MAKPGQEPLRANFDGKRQPRPSALRKPAKVRATPAGWNHCHRTLGGGAVSGLEKGPRRADDALGGTPAYIPFGGKPWHRGLDSRTELGNDTD